MIYIDKMMSSLGLTSFYDEVYMGMIVIGFSLLLLILLNFRKVFSMTTVIYLLWFVAIAFLAYAGNIIFCDKNNQYDISTLFLPIGIILASFIASVSVIRAVKSNETLKKMDILAERHAQLLYMLHTIYEIRDSYNNIVASNNFAIHKHMFFENDQKRIRVIFQNYATLLQDKYFYFFASSGYNEFKELQNSIFELHENADAAIGSNFSTKYTLFQTTLMSNLDALLEILEKQQTDLNQK